LASRGPNAFDSFVKALEDTEQSHAATALTEAVKQFEMSND